MALTDIKVRSAKSQERNTRLSMGMACFCLFILTAQNTGGAAFALVTSIGVYPETSLADARQKREEAKRLVAAGVDPREHKRAAKEEQAKEVITFESVARDWNASNQKWSESHSGVFLKAWKIICSMRLVSGISLS